MESECSRCQRKFQSTAKGQTVCPRCLSEEFSAAKPIDSRERLVLEKELGQKRRRQTARAERMQVDYNGGSAFGMVGKLRFALAIVLFAGGQFLFLLGSGEHYSTIISELAPGMQRTIAMIISVFAASLLLFSSRRRRNITWLLMAFFLVAGWFAPDIWSKTARDRVATELAGRVDESRRDGEEVAPPSRELSQRDLEVFEEQKKAAPRQVHYAVYIDNQNARIRTTFREAFTRLLDAEYTRAYTRAGGILYVICNASASADFLGRVLTRFGQISFADDSAGVYEVRYDEEKANMVSRYSPSVLSTPLNSSFVAANISELRSVDPMRVRIAATALAQADVKALRHEVRDVLLAVLQDPWSREPDTYRALVEALSVYAAPGDARSLRVCRDYFDNSEAQPAVSSPTVLEFLIREDVDGMVEPIVKRWSEDPVLWAPYLPMLGEKVEPVLLKTLKETSNLGIISIIMKHLRLNGTPAAIPVVQSFLNHEDSTVRYAAKATLSALQERQQ